MIATLLAAGWVAAIASWTPLTSFTLNCTGTQTGYTDDTGQKQTLPWSQTFSVDLVAGTYCTQGCARPYALSALTTDGLDLDNATSQYGSTLRRFHALSGQFETNIITAASATQRFHLQQNGACTLQSAATGS